MTNVPACAPVSVVIPYFNADSTIERALDSIAAQSLLPFEVIVVDDASNSNAVTALIEAASKCQAFPIRVLRQEKNRGAASARNRGWNEASQEYIAFLDSDDSWHPEKILLQTRFFEGHPEVSLCAHDYCIGQMGSPWEVVEDSTNLFSSSLVITAQQLLVKNRFVSPSVMLRRSIPLRFQEEQRYMEDHLLWTRIAIAGFRIAYLPLPLTRLHKNIIGESGLSAQLIPMQMADAKNYWKLYAEGSIGLFSTLMFTGFSFAKFLRRLLIVARQRTQASRAARGSQSN